MGVLGSNPIIDERLAAMPGVMGHPDPSPFEGIVQATLGSVPSGIDKVASMLQDATSSFGSGEIDPATGQWLTRQDVIKRDAQAQQEGFRTQAQPSAGVQALQDWGQFDARDTGSVGRVVHGVGESLTVAGLGTAFGPWGAASLLGTTYGHSGYVDARAQGVDTKTAVEIGTMQGIVAAAGAFIPMKFGKSLLSSVGLGAGVNVAIGATQRFASSKLLEANGYPAMAAQYRVWDTQALAADLILGGAFGAWGHFTAPAVRESLSPAEVDAASAVAAEQVVNRSAPGVPKDPATANDHLDALQGAVSDILEGRTPEVDPELAQRVADGVLPDEANPPNADEVAAAAHDEFGIVYDAAVADIPESDIMGLSFGQDEGVQNNASGESAASLEAINRKAEEQSLGRTRLLIDRNGNVRPLIGPDADLTAQPGEVIVQRNIGKNEWTVLSQGDGVSESIAQGKINRAQAALAEHAQPEAQQPQGEGPGALDPFHAAQLEHLVQNYGDMPYVDENGTLTTIAEAARAMQAERGQATQDNFLHDIAAACAARNGG